MKRLMVLGAAALCGLVLAQEKASAWGCQSCGGSVLNLFHLAVPFCNGTPYGPAAWNWDCGGGSWAYNATPYYNGYTYAGVPQIAPYPGFAEMPQGLPMAPGLPVDPGVVPAPAVVPGPGMVPGPAKRMGPPPVIPGPAQSSFFTDAQPMPVQHGPVFLPANGYLPRPAFLPPNGYLPH